MNSTKSIPVPLAPDVTVNQEGSFVTAVQAQSGWLVHTLVVPLPPSDVHEVP
jgi:hypothetical protein